MYEIRNDGEILLYDEITRGMTARSLMKQLEKLDGTPTLRINSQGGDVFEAIALYNMLKGRGITVHVDGVCASAASVIAMSGEKIIMERGSMMMIHDPVSVVDGTVEQLRDMAGVLEKIRANVCEIYASRTGLETGVLLEMMSRETWFQSDEAVKYGFADEVSSVERAAPASTLTYEDGILAERERMKSLDQIMMPGREGAVMRAKYETFQSARDIALDLLRQESRTQESREQAAGEYTFPSVSDYMAGIISKARGWK